LLNSIGGILILEDTINTLIQSLVLQVLVDIPVEEDSIETVVSKESEDLVDEEPLIEDTVVEIGYAEGEEEFLATNFYKKTEVEYSPIWYAKNDVENDTEYSAEIHVEEGTRDLLTAEEAGDFLMEMQFAAVTGNSYSVNNDKKRQMDLWIKFNPALFGLFESLNSMTRDVNYSPLW